MLRFPHNEGPRRACWAGLCFYELSMHSACLIVGVLAQAREEKAFVPIVPFVIGLRVALVVSRLVFLSSPYFHLSPPLFLRC